MGIEERITSRCAPRPTSASASAPRPSACTACTTSSRRRTRTTRSWSSTTCSTPGTASRRCCASCRPRCASTCRATCSIATPWYKPGSNQTTLQARLLPARDGQVDRVPARAGRAHVRGDRDGQDGARRPFSIYSRRSRLARGTHGSADDARPRSGAWRAGLRHDHRAGLDRYRPGARSVAQTTTNRDGRCDAAIARRRGLVRAGVWQLEFHVAAYFAAQGVALPKPPFPRRRRRALRRLANPGEHHHVPLLVTPWAIRLTVAARQKRRPAKKGDSPLYRAKPPALGSDRTGLSSGGCEERRRRDPLPARRRGPASSRDRADHDSAPVPARAPAALRHEGRLRRRRLRRLHGRAGRAGRRRPSATAPSTPASSSCPRSTARRCSPSRA